MPSLNYSTPCSLAIALGANLPSPAGPPQATLIKIRPLLEKVICQWLKSLSNVESDIDSIKQGLMWHWSPLFKTEPIGSPTNQPYFTNAVLLVRGEELLKMKPSTLAALDLLNRFLLLEKTFGRDRKNSSIKWGPRSLDIDFLAWGDLHLESKDLVLPHPQLIERNFVLIPLAAALFQKDSSIIQIAPQPGWEE